MEDVLDVYKKPYNKDFPVVCMDEQPVQLIKETRVPLAMQKGKPDRYDYEYERNGTANVFMFAQPLGAWRKANIREKKTRIEWAEEIKELVDCDFPDAEKIILVMDNLNTHSKGSLYERFDPREAKRLANKLEIHYTPKHGSWLNIAEIELSTLTGQCLSRRIPDLGTLIKEVTAWNRERNRTAKNVDWQFTADDARVKLKRLYPQFKP